MPLLLLKYIYIILYMKIITTFAFSKKWDIIVKNKQLNNLMFSSFITHENYEINFNDLSVRLKSLNCNKLSIFNIHHTCEKFSKRKLYNYNDSLEISRKNPKYNFFDLSISQLFELDTLFNKLFKKDKNEYLNNSIFIWNNLAYSFLVNFYNNPMYKKIDDILNNNSNNYQKQLKIENNLKDFWRKEILLLFKNKKNYFHHLMD